MWVYEECFEKTVDSEFLFLDKSYKDTMFIFVLGKVFLPLPRVIFANSTPSPNCFLILVNISFLHVLRAGQKSII
jgi:hypothetical protein